MQETVRKDLVLQTGTTANILPLRIIYSGPRIYHPFVSL